MDSGLFLPADHKLAPQVGVAWGTMKLHSSNLVCTWILGCSCPRRPEIGPQVGVAWGTCPISKFRDPLNMSVSDEATLFKFGVHLDPGLFLHADQKLAPKRAWPGVCTQFRNFGTRSISVGRMKLRFSNLLCTWILGCSCPQTRNWPPSGRGLGNVPNFEISGPPQYLCIG